MMTPEDKELIASARGELDGGSASVIARRELLERFITRLTRLSASRRERDNEVMERCALAVEYLADQSATNDKPAWWRDGLDEAVTVIRKLKETG